MQDVNTVAVAIPIVWQCIIGVGGGITAIAAAITVILKPWRAMKAELNALKKELEDLKKQHADDQRSNDRRLAADLEVLDEVKSIVSYMHYGVMVLLDHAATGNSVDRCKEARDKLEKHSSGI